MVVGVAVVVGAAVGGEVGGRPVVVVEGNVVDPNVVVVVGAAKACTAICSFVAGSAKNWAAAQAVPTNPIEIATRITTARTEINLETRDPVAKG